jgi:transcriptional regulator with XRE-family HTH domain
VADTFDVSGALRRIRRIADLAQRELAAAASISPGTLANAEAGRRDLPVQSLVRAAAVAGLRLALVSETGEEVASMHPDAVRDMGGRRFPAHLDTRYGDDRWWHGPERYSRTTPWYTFDRDRRRRDAARSATGTASDHRLPQPGDAPANRAAARRRAARQARVEKLERRRAAGELRPIEPLICTCPPECDELDDWSGKPVHAEECRCRCDVG